MGISNSNKIIAAIIGSNGALGSALTEILCQESNVSTIYACSRHSMPIHLANLKKIKPLFLDLTDENSIANAATAITSPLQIIMIATGILHEQTLQPEKKWQQLANQQMEKMFAINTIGPALVLKHFLPHLSKSETTWCGVISAKVGSISDNNLGGWYSYRASKAALNMLVKTTAIELSRTHPQSVLVSLHPGTVDSNLSRPFQRNLRPGQLLSPAISAKHLWTLLKRLTPADTGNFFSYTGEKLPF